MDEGMKEWIEVFDSIWKWVEGKSELGTTQEVLWDRFLILTKLVVERGGGEE